MMSDQVNLERAYVKNIEKHIISRQNRSNFNINSFFEWVNNSNCIQVKYFQYDSISIQIVF